MASIFESNPEPDRLAGPPAGGEVGSNDHVRVGDAERLKTVRALNEHFAAGRLTAQELGAAASATTRGELRSALTGLPSGQSTLQNRLLQQEQADAECRAAQARNLQSKEERTAIATELLRQLVREAFPILMTRNPRKLLEVTPEFIEPLFFKLQRIARYAENAKYRFVVGRTGWTNQSGVWALSDDGEIFRVGRSQNGRSHAQAVAQAQQFAKHRGFHEAVFSLQPMQAQSDDPNLWHDADNYLFFLDPVNPGQLLYGYSAKTAKPAEDAMAEFLRK